MTTTDAEQKTRMNNIIGGKIIICAICGETDVVPLNDDTGLCQACQNSIDMALGGDISG